MNEKEINKNATAVMAKLNEMALEMHVVYGLLREMKNEEIEDAFCVHYNQDLKELLGHLGLSLAGIAHIISVDMGTLVQEKIDEIVREEQEMQGK